MSFLNKIRDLMLGAEEDYEEDFINEDEDDDEPIKESSSKNRTDSRAEFIAARGKKAESNISNSITNNVVNMPSSYTPQREHMIICVPKTIDDAPALADCLKQNAICVINLEGVEYSDAQRIADFLGGAAYSLTCEIERVSNDIFIIAPSHVGISNAMKEEIKTGGSILPWISSALKQ